MRCYLITYGLERPEERSGFQEELDEKLQQLGMQKEAGDPPTFFGPYPKIWRGLVKDLYDSLRGMEWQEKDRLTLHFPYLSTEHGRKVPDIDRWHLKRDGDAKLRLPVPKEGE
ncbi:MAG: hypothetical protein ABEH38_08875 [Flavobacteriales bacterium]